MNDFFEHVGFIVCCLVIILFIGGVFGTIAYRFLYLNHPPAIEVYRGNTTLEITYRDSIPVDSIVVFKPRKK